MRWLFAVIITVLFSSPAFSAMMPVLVGSKSAPVNINTNFGNIQYNFTVLEGKILASAVLDGSTLTITLADGTPFSVDLSQLEISGVAEIDDAATAGNTTATWSADFLTTMFSGKADALGGDDNYVTDAQKTALANLSTTLAGYMAKTGDETVNGVKTYVSSPIVPTPTTDFQAATKKYVDDNAGGGASVADTPYDSATWDGVVDIAPSMNVIRDWIESISTIGTYTSGTESDIAYNLMTPQGVYDIDATNHAFTLDPYTKADQTLSEIRISCDKDPTTELTITFSYKAAGVGYGTPTTIEAVTTTAGVANITTGIDDATIPAGSKIFGVLSDPDDTLLECAVKLVGAYD